MLKNYTFKLRILRLIQKLFAYKCLLPYESGLLELGFDTVCVIDRNYNILLHIVYILGEYFTMTCYA